MPKGLIPAGIGLVWFHNAILKSNSKKTVMEKTEEGHIHKRETNKSSFKQNGFPNSTNVALPFFSSSTEFKNHSFYEA